MCGNWREGGPGSSQPPQRSHGVPTGILGMWAGGVSMIPRCDSPQQGQKSYPGEGAVAWAGRRQASRNLGGKASTEVGRRSLRPSQVRRRGRRERRARVCRQGEAHQPQNPCSTFFLRTWARGSPRREVILEGPCSRTPGPATSHHPDPHRPNRTPHLDLPPGLAGGDGQHGGQIDVIHGGCASNP